MLELERMKELNEKALLIQKVLRGYRYRFGEKKLGNDIYIFCLCDLHPHVCMTRSL